MEEIRNIRYEQMREVFDSLDELEKDYILPNMNIDTETILETMRNCMIRIGYFINNECVGYMELYSYEDEACIVTAVKEPYRNRGIMKKLLDKIEEYCKYNIFIKKIIWGCDIRNKLSEKIAKKYNFEFYKSDENEVQYYKNN